MSHRAAWRIGSGSRLKGVFSVHGNKNSALPVLAASLLLPRIRDRLRVAHVPRIADVATMCDILAHFGIGSAWAGPEILVLTREREMPASLKLPEALVSRIRGSITLLGPLAGLYRTFNLPKPGGDKIGGRSIGAHIDALSELGVQVSNRGRFLHGKRSGKPVDQVWLTEQSVTGTLTVLLYSAFLPTRHLTIQGAACEPHIVTLCRTLIAMGARVDGMGSSIITIRWPARRHAPKTTIALDDDYMEATTYAVAAAVTKSDLSLKMRSVKDMELINRYMNWMGVRTALDVRRNHWRIYGRSSTLAVNHRLTVIKAEPWPRLPTDVMSVLVVLATQCTGKLKFIEYMYDDRFGFVQSLRDIGAHIDSQPPHAIIITGPTPLVGNELFLRPDIRSGAAMLLAALAASGTTILHDRGGVIERGYQGLPQTLAGLGAAIQETASLFD